MTVVIVLRVSRQFVTLLRSLLRRRSWDWYATIVGWYETQSESKEFIAGKLNYTRCLLLDRHLIRIVMAVPLLKYIEGMPRASRNIVSAGDKVIVGHLHQGTEVMEPFLVKEFSKFTSRWIISFQSKQFDADMFHHGLEEFHAVISLLAGLFEVLQGKIRDVFFVPSILACCFFVTLLRVGSCVVPDIVLIILVGCVIVDVLRIRS